MFVGVAGGELDNNGTATTVCILRIELCVEEGSGSEKRPISGDGSKGDSAVIGRLTEL